MRWVPTEATARMSPFMCVATLTGTPPPASVCHSSWGGGRGLIVRRHMARGEGGAAPAATTGFRLAQRREGAREEMGRFWEGKGGGR